MTAAERKKKIITGDMGLLRAVLVIALPFMLGNLCRVLGEVVDIAMLGSTESGTQMQSAIAFASPVVTATEGVVIGIAVGVGVLLARAVGRSDERECSRVLVSGLLLCLLCTLLVTLLVWLGGEWLLRAVCGDSEATSEAVTYLLVRASGLVLLLPSELFRVWRQSQGDTVLPLIVAVATVLVNIVLTYLLVVVFGLGVFGAALATVLSTLTALPFAVYTLFFSRRYMRVNGWHAGEFCHVAGVAFPLVLGIALPAFGFFAMQHFVISYGESIVASLAIGNRVCNVLVSPLFALTHVITTFIGQNEGCGNSERAKASYVTARNIAIVFASMSAVALLLTANHIVDLLTHMSEVRESCYVYLRLLALTLPLLALSQAHMGLFNGCKKTGYTFAIENVRLWVVRVPLVWLVSELFPQMPSGLYTAMVVSNVGTFMLGMVLARRILRTL